VEKRQYRRLLHLLGATGTANVGDPTRSVTGGFQLGALAGQSTNLTLAYFTDGNVNAAATDYQATINWGDGTDSTVSVGPAVDGLYQITAPHTYSAAGPSAYPSK
jgi:hypothetical protein